MNSPASGTRRFVLASRHAESDVITSFVLRPADGAPPPTHRAGQHLTLWADIPGDGRHKRNYTISCAPNGENWRISVRRQEEGRVSKWLHDHAAPGTEFDVADAAGSFVLPDPATAPVVMLSAGVGLTPMVAMLEQHAAAPVGWPIHFVHGARDGASHAFGPHVRALADQAPDVTVTTFYSRPRPEDREGRDYDISGHLTPEWILANTQADAADYFVCGPLDFLREMIGALTAAGVPTSRLHYEFFGPVEDLFDATPTPAPSSSIAAPHAATTIGGFNRADIADGLLDSAADAVIASDREGMIVLWNAGATRVFGFTQEEALGQSLDIIIPEPFRQRHWDGYHETVSTGQSRYGAGDLLAVPGLTKAGGRISLEFTIVLLKDDGGRVTGMASVLRDVTKRFEEMRALKKDLARLEERLPGP
ncbi:PAS domain S-box protein [Ancylobacter gelatini]|uniref:PAS domain S-box protein n=1 Tax=Ancylobacter gelatini TaxID=2919920 RepID=UPI00315AA9F0